MSNYKKKFEWCEIWDRLLFWNFMDNHRDFFIKNPKKLIMLISSFDKMSQSKKENHLLKNLIVLVLKVCSYKLI